MCGPSPGMLKEIRSVVELALASSMAFLRVPGPLSPVLVTSIVVSVNGVSVFSMTNYWGPWAYERPAATKSKATTKANAKDPVVILKLLARGICDMGTVPARRKYLR